MANPAWYFPVATVPWSSTTVNVLRMASCMPPFALTLSVSRHNQIEVQFLEHNGVFNVEPSLEETLSMEAIGVAGNIVQLLNSAGSLVHGGNNVFHSMRRFRKEHQDLTDEVTRAFELLQVLETIVRLLPAPQDQTTEACLDCGLQSSEIQGLHLTNMSLLDQLTREFPNYKARLSKIERILSKSTPSVGQPLRTFLRQFAWHFKKQVLHDLLFALERGKSSFVVIFHMATLKKFVYLLLHQLTKLGSMISLRNPKVPVDSPHTSICMAGLRYIKRA